MSDSAIISALLGCIGVLGGAVGFLYREYAARMKDHADEWRTYAKSLERTLDALTPVVESQAQATVAVQKSTESVVEMLTRIYYATFPVRGAQRLAEGEPRET